MRARWIIPAVLVALMAAGNAWCAPASRIMGIESMHGFHEKSRAYSYQALYEVVRRFNPDYVGIEIRPEDMARDLRYLQNSYPKEMIELAHEWAVPDFRV